MMYMYMYIQLFGRGMCQVYIDNILIRIQQVLWDCGTATGL